MKSSIQKYYYYFFYSVYSWYIVKGEKSIPGVYAIMVISSIFIFNIISLYFFLLLNNVIGKSVNGLIGGVFFLFVSAANYYFIYIKKGKDKIAREFQLDSHTVRKNIQRRLTIYSVSSILILIVLMVILLN